MSESSSSSQSSEGNSRTAYGEAQPISKEELSAMWSSFPYPVQKSLNLGKKGKLQPCTDEELNHLMDTYFKRDK